MIGWGYSILRTAVKNIPGGEGGGMWTILSKFDTRYIATLGSILDSQSS